MGLEVRVGGLEFRVGGLERRVNLEQRCEGSRPPDGVRSVPLKPSQHVCL